MGYGPSGGADPFDALLRALRPFTERAGLEEYQLVRDLADGQAEPSDVLRDVLTRGLEADRLFLFLDQMEELFTARDKHPTLVARFLSGLYAATQILPLQVLATIRSDLLHHCYAHRDLLSILNGRGHYALSEAAYEAMGGLTGAIAEHVGEVERALAKKLELERERLEPVLGGLFEALVQVDLEGLPTRRSPRQADLPGRLVPAVEVLIKERLLTLEVEGAESTLSVAHERLFQAWPALSRWIAEHQDDLRLLRQGELDAAEWRRQGHELAYLWHTDRLERLRQVIERVPADRTGDALRAFASPQPHLVRLLDDPALDHETRDSIGRHLATLGDQRPGVGLREDGTPDIDWVAIPGGSWRRSQVLAGADFRGHYHPYVRIIDLGFRVLCASPIR